MDNEKRDQMKRSEKNQRYRSKNRKKMDRLLNILIGIVSILIVLNLISIFTGEDQEEHEKIAETTNKKDDSKKATSKKDEENETNLEKMNEVSVTNTTNSESVQELATGVIVQASEDPIVDEVIINPNWKSTPTQQTGEHISTYTEGHIDYEEKLQTFSKAVQLEKENVIFWSVKNNGGPNSSVAVISSNDANRTEKYRIFIEWIDNEGWRPVKVEKLNQLAEAY